MKSKIRKDKNNQELSYKITPLKVKSFKKNYIYIIKCISFFLLIYSPILSLLWLLGPTIYFLWKRNYKAIFKIWGFTLGMWYLIFTLCMTCLTVTPIVIGSLDTILLLDYMEIHIEELMCKNLCFKTVYYLDFISCRSGFIFHIPVLLNVLKYF